MIARRAFLGVAASLLVAAAAIPQAQQAGRVYRIGVLVTSSLGHNPWWDAFIQRMRELGWVEKQNFVIVVRYTERSNETTLALAQELLAQKVDLIIAGSTEAALAAKTATETIPIVGAALADPVGSGLLTSLARPGGNVTGLSFLGSELVGKQLELLREALPSLSRVAVLVNPANPANAPRVREVETAALALKLRVEVLEAREADVLEAAFGAIARNGDEAILVLQDPLFRREASRIASLANRYRMPAVYGLKEHVLQGGLMSYGANFSDLFRRTAEYVDKILRGAKPADLPIEQPTKFELVINLKTAKALGLTIPQSLFLRADEVIQ